jgi:hypothetical protein
MALRTLKTILPRWKQWGINSRNLFHEASYPIPAKEIKFIGHIIQRFNRRRGKPAKPYQDRIAEINRVVEEELVPALTGYDMCFDLSSLHSKHNLQNHCLSEISEFGALLQKSHEYSVPVFSLSDAQIGERGPVFEQLDGNRKRFNDIFTSISQIIMDLLPCS